MSNNIVGVKRNCSLSLSFFFCSESIGPLAFWYESSYKVYCFSSVWGAKVICIKVWSTNIHLYFFFICLFFFFFFFLTKTWLFISMGLWLSIVLKKENGTSHIEGAFKSYSFQLKQKKNNIYLLNLITFGKLIPNIKNWYMNSWNFLFF